MKMRLLLLFLLVSVNAFAGYDAHITRRKDWSDDKGPSITLKEWKDLIARDPEMRLQEVEEGIGQDGKKVRTENPGMAVWVKYSKHEEGQRMAFFIWRQGNIEVKSPDFEIIGKMFRLAKKLGGRVQGDDGEIYDESGKIVP